MNSAKGKKLFPIVLTVSAAVSAILIGLAGEAFGDQLKELFTPLLAWWKWLLGSLVVINVVAFGWDRWHTEQPAEAATETNSQSGNRNAIIGSGASGNTTVTGNANLTASQTQGDFVAGTKIENHYHGSQLSTPDSRLPTPPPTNRLRQINSPPRDFVGRQTELRELLADLETGAVISGVQGKGGIGKTTLALKLAERLGQQFTGAQLFLDLQGMSATPVKTTSAMEHVIRSFHSETGQLPNTVAELQPLYQSILQTEVSAGQRVLLLFDNAKDRAQVEPLIPPAGCVMLVTSRAHFTLPGMKERNLEALPMADARDLLTELCDRCQTEAEELATLCGRLPMALRIVGSFLRERRDYPVARYLEKLRAARLKQLPEVAASLQLSCEQLPPELLAHWHKLSVFPDSFDLRAAAAVLEMDADGALDPLSELVRFSLLDWLDAEQRYTMHDLARDYTDSFLTDDEREELKLNHAQHFCRVLAEAKALYKAGGEQVVKGMALFDRERTHIETGQFWAANRREASPAAAELCVEYPNAGVYVLSLRQHPREWIGWLEIQLTAARRLKRQSMEGNALGNLGLAYANLGETRKAIEFYEQALVASREIGDRRNEGAWLGNLGSAYANLGETRKAIEFYEQRIVIAREIGDRRGEGNSLGNLGVSYEMLEETNRAIEYYEKAMILSREVGDMRNEASLLGSLGMSYFVSNEDDKSFEYLERALALSRELEDPGQEATWLFMLGGNYYFIGEKQKAIEKMEAALKIYGAIESPHAAMVREQLAKWRSEG
ncbi:MAG: tetratricopeptide repeat protein [Acidobacteriota bacterium]|nr:tetratricopeptide repeat protein [Acidobacteriota bacterium]